MNRLARSALFALPLLFAFACGEDDNGGTPAGSAGSSAGGASSGGGSGGSGATGGSGDTQGFGPVWIIKRDLQKVAVLDGEGNELFTDSVSSEPLGLALEGNNAWVILEGGQILRYDVGARVRKATITGARKPQRLAAAGNAAWVVDDTGVACGGTPEEGPRRLHRVDGATDKIVSTTNLNLDETGSSCDPTDALAADAQGAYALINNGFGVMRITNDGKVAGRAKLGLEGGYGTGNGALTSTTLWVVDRPKNRLLDLDPATLAQRATIALPDDVTGAVMTASDKAVWLGSPAGILRIDATATSTTKTITLEALPDAFARSTRGLYVAGGGGEGAIVILDAVTGEKKGQIPQAYADGLAVPLSPLDRQASERRPNEAKAPMPKVRSG